MLHQTKLLCAGLRPASSTITFNERSWAVETKALSINRNDEHASKDVFECFGVADMQLWILVSEGFTLVF